MSEDEKPEEPQAEAEPAETKGGGEMEQPERSASAGSAAGDASEQGDATEHGGGSSTAVSAAKGAAVGAAAGAAVGAAAVAAREMIKSRGGEADGGDDAAAEEGDAGADEG